MSRVNWAYILISTLLGSCIVWTFVINLAQIVSGAVSRLLLLLRVFALYDRKKSVFIFLGALFVSTNTAVFVTGLMSIIEIKGQSYHEVARVPPSP